MIYICSGIPKSASTICFKYIESSLLHYMNGNSKSVYSTFYYRWGLTTFFKLIFKFIFYKNIIVKTHSSPTILIRLLLYLKIAKAIYTIRDPRDVILSTIDFKGTAKNKLEFSKHTTIKNTIHSVKKELNVYLKWKKMGKVLFINYEDILLQPEKTIEKINHYFNIPIDIKKIKDIVLFYSKNPVNTLNKKILCRYKTEMTNSEIKFCNAHLKKYINIMNYSL
jgi:hypothetical protein